MRFLYVFLGGILAILVFFVLTLVSFRVFGYSIFSLIFGQSGLQIPVVLFIGTICGWLFGTKIQDQREQAQINRELEQDRIKYEKENSKSPFG